MRFIYIYTVLIIADLIAVSMSSKPLEYIFKPALMLTLGVYFFQKTRHSSLQTQRKWVMAALVFSLVGDILLMFEGQFISGLIAFLTAHICYIIAFLRDNKGSIFSKSDRFTGVLSILAYSSVFLYVVLPKVDAPLKVPIGIYALIISIMLLTVLNRWKSVNAASFQWALVGALLFVMSDSILAINKFVQPFAMSHIFIMLTYAFGQFMIIEGVILNKKP